jgi:hypothetical protein
MLLIRGNNSASSAARAKARADCVCFPRRPRRRAREVAREQCQLACVMPPDLRVRCASAAFAARLRAITCAVSLPGRRSSARRGQMSARGSRCRQAQFRGGPSRRRSHDIVRALANGRAGTAFPCSVDGATDGGDAIISARADLAYMPASPTPPSPPPACCDPWMPARPDMIYALWPTSVSVLPLHPTSWLGELAVVMDVSANCWPTSQAIAARFCMV